jgi:hypothetical protein
VALEGPAVPDVAAATVMAVGRRTPAVEGRSAGGLPSAAGRTISLTDIVNFEFNSTNKYGGAA